MRRLLVALSVVVGVASTTWGHASGETVTLDVGPAKLTAVSWGGGEVVLLLPGLGRSSESFEQFGPRLAESGYRAVALNPRGIRGSTGSLERLSLHDYAADVAGAIRALGVTRAHLVGWAFGNRVARAAAADFGTVVQSVTLIAAGGSVPGDSEASVALERLQSPTVSEADRVAAARVALFSPSSDPTPFLHLWTALWPEARAAQSTASRATPLNDWWSGGLVPMLVIQGLQDRTAPPANGRALKSQFPERVQLIELENAGHAVLLEQPTTVLKHVLTFLKAHRVQRN
jgi:pimeloyl-ACP methyl ester carboxylesterase